MTRLLPRPLQQMGAANEAAIARRKTKQPRAIYSQHCGYRETGAATTWNSPKKVQVQQRTTCTGLLCLLPITLQVRLQQQTKGHVPQSDMPSAAFLHKPCRKGYGGHTILEHVACRLQLQTHLRCLATILTHVFTSLALSVCRSATHNLTEA